VPIITISLSDDDYQKLKEKASALGYSTVTELIIDAINAFIEERESGLKASAPADAELIKKEIGSLLRKIQDTINPYTSKIDELARKAAEILERLDSLEKTVAAQFERPAAERRPAAEAREKKTALDYLKVDGYVLQSDLKWLKKPEAFFAKLKREGAIVIEGDRGYIAIDSEFYREFSRVVESVRAADLSEAVKSMPAKYRRLFQALADEGLVIYDSNSKSWKITF